MKKYVECKHCGKAICMGKPAIIYRGYVGVFCSAKCCVSEYRPEVRQINLTEDLAEDYETEIYETDVEYGTIYSC